MISFSFKYLLPAIVFLPLAAALCSALIKRASVLRGITVLFACAYFCLIVLVAALFLQQSVGAETVASLGEERYQLGAWGAPLGIDLYIDGFSLLMLVITASLSLILSMYSTSYFSDSEKLFRFLPLWWSLLSGLSALFVSGDAFNFYVCLEIVGFASAALVALEKTRTALEAALRYLLVGLLGSLFYLMGVALLYRTHGTLDLVQLAQLSSGDLSESLALGLITIGLLLKIALFPLHFWLPSAHANAATPVSAILSAVVVKASLFILIRFWFDILPGSVSTVGANMLGLMAGAAIIWGAMMAVRAERLKVMIAYSTVAQLGYIFLLFPVAASASHPMSFSGTASQAAIYFIAAHACAKAAMFLAAGNIIIARGHDRIADLTALVKQQPVSVLVFAIAGASLVGLPPSAGFLAKWLLLNAAVENGQWWWVFVILSGGLIAAVYVFRFLGVAFDTSKHSLVQTPAGPDHSINSDAGKHVPMVLHLCALFLALLTVLLGFNAEFILRLDGSSLSTLTGSNGGVYGF